MDTNNISPEDLKNKIEGRDLYLWGAGHIGLGLSKVLERIGISCSGFIDSSNALSGRTVRKYPIFLPEQIINKYNKHKYFIIITSSKFEQEIEELCIQKSLEKDTKYISYRSLCPFDFLIDIAGVCNLRCISCPRGNYPKKLPAGHMTAEAYARVLDKILVESPFLGSIALWSWGEPLLNPELPQIIRMTNDRKVLCAISSNLCMKKNFRDVIRAKPEWFKVSVSGFEESYEVTHTGGNWNIFLNNLYRLKEFKEKFNPEMQVEVNYHIYRHNQNEDYRKVKAICKGLDFAFRSNYAFLAPLDNIMDYLEGKELSENAKKTIDLLVLKIDDAMELAKKQVEFECEFFRSISINWNLSVNNCVLWYGPERNIAVDNFLKTPFMEIMAVRKDNPLCKQCKANAVHRYNCVYSQETIL